MKPSEEARPMTAASLSAPGLLGINLPGGYEWLILLVLGLLIFGRRLPEVGRSLGRGIVEFKKGIKGIDEEIESESSRAKEPARVGAAARQELPRTSPPAEPRVSRSAAPAEADRAEGPANADRDNG
jgi:sec-independent protein translocase protein TatA